MIQKPACQSTAILLALMVAISGCGSGANRDAPGDTHLVGSRARASHREAQEETEEIGEYQTGIERIFDMETDSKAFPIYKATPVKHAAWLGTYRIGPGNNCSHTGIIMRRNIGIPEECEEIIRYILQPVHPMCTKGQCEPEVKREVWSQPFRATVSEIPPRHRVCYNNCGEQLRCFNVSLKASGESREESPRGYQGGPSPYLPSATYPDTLQFALLNRGNIAECSDEAKEEAISSEKIQEIERFLVWELGVHGNVIASPYIPHQAECKPYLDVENVFQCGVSVSVKAIPGVDMDLYPKKLTYQLVFYDSLCVKGYLEVPRASEAEEVERQVSFISGCIDEPDQKPEESHEVFQLVEK